ncbi:MAG: outer membrane protein assembly factor BamA [Treponema sp.]|jgi:outer membrane protein insertion porin family|nr:outer membrane protein assembly factor BamA [Treponema sp.]
MRVVWIAVCLCAVTGFGFAQQSGEWYQDKPVRDIIFDGLKNVKNADLEGITGPFISRPFNDDVYHELTGKLYALDYFDSLTLSAVPADTLGSGVILRFRVVEKPVVSRIEFRGNSGIRRSELLSAVTLKVNDVVNQTKIRLDETAVVNKYQEKGYPQVKVSSESRLNANGGMDITFVIEEGDKVIIEAISFEGNSAFSSRTLMGQLSLKAKGLLNDGAFQRAKLIADREKVLRYYLDRGYVDAEVIPEERINDEKDGRGGASLIITFRITEGRLYTFGGATFEGNRIFTTQELTQLVYSKEGAVVNARRLEADLQRVADHYSDSGYINNAIDPQETRDRDTGVLSYHIVIVERSRAHIESIKIVGNSKTKEQVILREIPLEPGDIFSKNKLMEGWRNLMNLQYFSSVIPDIQPGSADGLMELFFNLEEQPTTDIQLGVTFSGSADPNAFPISGLVKFSDRNFLGYGNRFGVDVNASPDTQTVTVEYVQNWLFGLPLSGGFDFTFRHQKRLASMNNGNFGPLFNGDEVYAWPDGFYTWDDYNTAGKQPPDEYLMPYDQFGLSLGFSTGYRWSTPAGNLGLGGGIRLGWIFNEYDPNLWRPFDPVLREGVKTWVPALSFYTSLSLDQRDLYYDPSKGYYAVQRFGWYGILPIEREHYTRTDTKAEWFFTLFSLPIGDTYNLKAVFGIHSGLSFIFPQPGFDAPKIEAANKLSVDGMFVGRGWTSERINRGLALWENWAEIRFPIVPNMLALDFFFDAAAKKDTPQELFTAFEEEDMLYSFGAGLRFSIPQFPLRFIFAKRFITKDGKPELVTGTLGADDRDGSGIDFVLSFNMSTY